MKYEQEDPYYLAYRPRRHSHGHLLRDGLGCILQMRRRRKMPYRKQQLPEHSQVRGNDHHDDYRVLYRQELHLQARPHLFADRFRHGSVRRFLPKDLAQLYQEPRSRKRTRLYRLQR